MTSPGSPSGAGEKAQAVPIRIHHEHVADLRTERVARRLLDWNSSLSELRIAFINVRHVEVHQATELAVARVLGEEYLHSVTRDGRENG